MATILESLVNSLKPKAHDAMDAIKESWDNMIEQQNTWKELGYDPAESKSILESFLLDPINLIPAFGGIKKLKNFIAMKGKIKGGKMIPQQPFRQGMVGKPTRHSSVIGGPNPFVGKHGKGKLAEFKELVDEYDYVGLAHPERADEIFSIFQKQFGNKNAAKVMDILYKQILGK